MRCIGCIISIYSPPNFNFGVYVCVTALSNVIDQNGWHSCKKLQEGPYRSEASERQVRVLLGHGNHKYDPESNTCRPYYIISLDVQHNYIHPSPLLTNITRRLKNHNRIDFAFPTQTENPITPPVALEPGDCYYAA